MLRISSFGLFILLLTAGCSFPTQQQAPTVEIPIANTVTLEVVDPGRPEVNILSPPSGSNFPAGDQVVVESVTIDTGPGVIRVDLLVNGSLVNTSNTPEDIPQNNFSILHTWTPNQIGEFVLSVIAYRSDGTPSDPALISINVSEPTALEEAPQEQACTVTAKTRLNMRQLPEVGQQIEDVLPLGQKVPVTGKVPDGSWLQVYFNNQTGWIFAELTYSEGNCDTVPVVNPSIPIGVETQTAIATLVSTYVTTQTVGGTEIYTPTITQTPNPAYTATNTQAYTPTLQFTPTYTPTPTRTPTMQFTPTRTPTMQFTPTRTPTMQFTPTYTFTPTRTPTVSGPIAPPDANFNSPLTIPYNGNASVTDFVSYPDGDTIDKVRYDVSGMPQTGTANLTISASCFGTGTQHVTFSTGGQTVACGQTVVTRVITTDSKTGTVTITAVGGTNTYIQWVLTGSVGP
jgi:uncharacterized protein YraI